MVHNLQNMINTTRTRLNFLSEEQKIWNIFKIVNLIHNIHSKHNCFDYNVTDRKKSRCHTYLHIHFGMWRKINAPKGFKNNRGGNRDQVCMNSCDTYSNTFHRLIARHSLKYTILHNITKYCSWIYHSILLYFQPFIKLISHWFFKSFCITFYRALFSTRVYALNFIIMSSLAMHILSYCDFSFNAFTS